MIQTTTKDRPNTRTLNVIGDAVTVLFSHEDGTAFEMFDLHGEAQSGPPPHTHPWDEAYYVLEGQVLVVVGDDERVLEPGDVANVPGGEQHLYRILSPRARFLVITSPEGAAAFFRDMDANVGPLPDSLATLVAVAKRNKLTSPLFPD